MQEKFLIVESETGGVVVVEVPNSFAPEMRIAFPEQPIGSMFNFHMIAKAGTTISVPEPTPSPALVNDLFVFGPQAGLASVHFYVMRKDVQAYTVYALTRAS